MFSFVFFTRIYPIVIFDTDDWLYTSYSRIAVPLWGNWNPARILPETLMSLSANFGVYVINPVINDYIGSITISYGLVLSVCISIYLYRFLCFIKAKFNASLFVGVALSILFLLFHFWAFKRAGSNNDYFLRSHDAACYFYYIIPNLFNATMVLYFFEKKKYSFNDYNSKLTAGSMIVCIYFLIFSNLFPAIILVSFFCYVILLHIFRNKKTHTVFSSIKQIQIPVLGLILWIVSLVFEWKGARATSEDLMYDFDLMGTVKTFISTLIHSLNIWFVIFAVIVVVASFIVLIFNRKKPENKKYFHFLGLSAFCIIVTLIYSLLLCAKVASFYAARTDILFCVFFFGFLLLSVLSCVLIRKPLIKMITPLILIIICSLSFVTGHRAFKESNIAQLDANKCKQIDNYLIEQIKEAEDNGSREVKLHVPVFSSDNNWPLPEYGVQWIADTLYKQRIISSEMTVVYCPDSAVNEKFGLDTPYELP